MTEICTFSDGTLDMANVTSVYKSGDYLYFMDKNAKEVYKTYNFTRDDLEIVQNFFEERKKKLLAKAAYPSVLQLSNWILNMSDVNLVQRLEEDKELILGKNKQEIIYELTYQSEEKLNADFKLISDYILNRDLKMKN